MWWEFKDFANSSYSYGFLQFTKFTGVPFDFAKAKLFREILQISLTTKSVSGLLYAKV